METHIHMILIRNGHEWKNIILGPWHSKHSENGSENININVFLPFSAIIIITSYFPHIHEYRLND